MKFLFISFIIIITIIFIIFFIKIINCDKKIINFIENFEDLSSTLISTTNEILLPSPTVSPLIEIKTETDKLENIKKENKELQFKKDLLEVKLQELDNKYKNVLDETNKKTLEKSKLEEDLLNINQQKETNLKMMEVIRNSINENTEKEVKLTKMEKILLEQKKDIDDKTKYYEDIVLKPVPTLPPVTLKEEQINSLLSKLESLEKIFLEVNKKSDNILKLTDKNKSINNVCTANDTMPEPSEDSFSNNLNDIQPNTQEIKNLPYLWCGCNDANKNTPECKKYLDCHKNYEYNSKKASLEGDDLTLYFKCINDFKNFPAYITKNNKKD